MRIPPPLHDLLGKQTTKPAIVIPGGPCRGIDYLEDLAGLAEVRPLAIYHPRGTPLTDGLSAGWWADATEVLALADHLGLDKVDILAHSAGTRLALAFAAQFPGRVGSLALITPPADWLTGIANDADHLIAQRNDAVSAAAWKVLAKANPHNDEEYQQVCLDSAPISYARWSDVERAHAHVGTVTMAAAQAWFRDIPTDAAARICAISVLPPILIVAGTDDGLCGVEPITALAAQLEASLRWVEDCGHYPWVEQPAQFRSIVDQWLLSQPTTRNDSL